MADPETLRRMRRKLIMRMIIDEEADEDQEWDWGEGDDEPKEKRTRNSYARSDPWQSTWGRLLR